MKSTQSPHRQLWVILAVVFFGYVGLAMPYLIFPYIFFNPAYAIVPATWSEASRGILLGITLAAFPLGQFLGSPILGAFSDEHGRRITMSVSLLVAAVCSLFSAFSLQWNMVWLLVVSRFMAGFMEGNIAIARAMAADLKELNKHRTFGRINAVASAAFIIGPLLGGLLSDPTISKDLTLSTPFFLVSALYAILALVSYVGIAERTRPILTPSRSFRERIDIVGRLRRLSTNRRLMRLLLIITLLTLAVDIFYEFGPVFLATKWQLRPTMLAVYNGCFALAAAAASAWAAEPLAKRFSNRTIITMGITTLASTLIALVFTPLEGSFYAIFSVMGLAVVLATTNLTVQVSDSVSDQIQGEVMGVQVSLRVLCDALICLFGGVLLALSPALVILLAAGIALAALWQLQRPS